MREARISSLRIRPTSQRSARASTQLNAIDLQNENIALNVARIENQCFKQAHIEECLAYALLYYLASLETVHQSWAKEKNGKFRGGHRIVRKATTNKGGPYSTLDLGLVVLSGGANNLERIGSKTSK